MKKALLIAAVAGLTLVSCKKDYTCECTSTVTDYDSGVATSRTPTTVSGETGKMKKDDAKASCDKGDSETMVGDTQDGVKVVAACEIK